MTMNDPELEAAQKEAAKSRQADKRWKMWLALAVLMLAAVTAAAVVLAQSNARLASENAAFASQQQDEKKDIAKEASRALCGVGDREIYDRDLCEKWAAAAQEPDVEVTEPPVVVGPSQAELVNAFRDYCSSGNCKGQDGRPPTPEDIAAAFVKFCADGRCNGTAGKDGKDGRDGVNGQSIPPTPEAVLAAVTGYCSTGVCRGADGPPPELEAISAAVQAFCAADACRGAAGTDGQKGDKGDPPASITFTDQTGTTYTCTPDPPGSTTYTCSGTPKTTNR